MSTHGRMASVCSPHAKKPLNRAELLLELILSELFIARFGRDAGPSDRNDGFHEGDRERTLAQVQRLREQIAQASNNDGSVSGLELWEKLG